jgi:hypothetical protein
LVLSAQGNDSSRFIKSKVFSHALIKEILYNLEKEIDHKKAKEIKTQIIGFEQRMKSKRRKKKSQSGIH